VAGHTTKLVCVSRGFRLTCGGGKRETDQKKREDDVLQSKLPDMAPKADSHHLGQTPSWAGRNRVLGKTCRAGGPLDEARQPKR